MDVPFMKVYGEYDHKDRKQRKFYLSNWYKKFSLTEKDFKTEEMKCRPLCPCHHAQHSHKQRQEESKTKKYNLDRVHALNQRLAVLANLDTTEVVWRISVGDEGIGAFQVRLLYAANEGRYTYRDMEYAEVFNSRTV